MPTNSITASDDDNAAAELSRQLMNELTTYLIVNKPFINGEVFEKMQLVEGKLVELKGYQRRLQENSRLGGGGSINMSIPESDLSEKNVMASTDKSIEELQNLLHKKYYKEIGND